MATPPMVGFFATHLYNGNVVLTPENHRTSTEYAETEQVNGFAFPYTFLHAGLITLMFKHHPHGTRTHFR